MIAQTTNDDPLWPAGDATAGHRRGRPSRSVLADGVYEALKGLVMDHTIAPGIRIGIDSLSRQLGVSPTPVREALARLEAEHLVIKEPMKGYRTTPLLSANDVRDLYAFRLTIEPVAAAQAARRGADDQLHAIVAEAQRHRSAPDGDSYGDYRDFTAHDERFHRLIFDAAGNEFARRSFDSLHVHLHVFRLYYGTEHGGLVSAEHAEAAAAIADRDPGRAEQAIREHLTRSLGRVLSAHTSPDLDPPREHP